jgi:pilus assembly protein CpaF
VVPAVEESGKAGPAWPALAARLGMDPGEAP